MRKLTFTSFLRRYLAELTGVQTAAICRLAAMTEANPRVKEPLFLYAAACGKTELLLHATHGTACGQEYRALVRQFPGRQLVSLLETQDAALPEGCLKVWRSYCSVRDAARADDHTKTLLHRRVLEMQAQKHLSNYRLYTDLHLNPGNVNAWLKHNDSRRVSLACARQIYLYAKNYPAV